MKTNLASGHEPTGLINRGDAVRIGEGPPVDHDDEPTRDEVLTTAQIARLRATDPQDYTVLFLAYEAMLKPPREENDDVDG